MTCICTSQLHRDHSPVHKDTATAIEAVLDETIGCREVLQQILIVYIIDLDEHVVERAEQLLVQRHTQDREDMRDVGVPESFLAAEREYAAAS